MGIAFSYTPATVEVLNEYAADQLSDHLCCSGENIVFPDYGKIMQHGGSRWVNPIRRSQVGGGRTRRISPRVGSL